MMSRAIHILNERAYRTVLNDYSEAAPGDFSGVLSQLQAAGFKFHDLSKEADPEHRGVLILTGEGNTLKAIAFVSLVKISLNGFLIDIHRFDKGCRTDTLELRKVTSWN
ncbi:MAG: hypothetical protein C0392_15955 [Syntrophus sp. (in: bacteria)]|nr:hypothetical protein [Syntrophus sp. (in: bacteria)]